MFGRQTMFDVVWSPNISRLDRPLKLKQIIIETKIISASFHDVCYYSITNVHKGHQKEFSTQFYNFNYILRLLQTFAGLHWSIFFFNKT